MRVLLCRGSRRKFVKQDPMRLKIVRKIKARLHGYVNRAEPK